jgi:hypothetical protein
MIGSVTSFLRTSTPTVTFLHLRKEYSYNINHRVTLGLVITESLGEIKVALFDSANKTITFVHILRHSLLFVCSCASNNHYQRLLPLGFVGAKICVGKAKFLDEISFKYYLFSSIQRYEGLFITSFVLVTIYWWFWLNKT